MIFAIALGGALGTLGRWGLGLLWDERSGHLPWLTLAINLAGSFLLGYIARTFNAGGHSPLILAGLTVGICGGFTTFSAFSYQMLGLVEGGQWPRAVLYALLSVGLGLAAVAGGAALARSVRAG